MAEERKIEPEDLTKEPPEFEVEELDDDELEGAAGGDTNNGCTINKSIAC